MSTPERIKREKQEKAKLSSSKVIGHVEIQTLRADFEPNYRVYILLPTELKNLGEFAVEKWKYAYAHEDKLDIWEINKAEKPSKEVEAYLKAFVEVMKETWFAYEIMLASKENKETVEWELSEWLEQEGYPNVLFFITKLGKVKSRKRIPITEEAFKKILEKQKEKGANQP